jgi:hypothetical protein
VAGSSLNSKMGKNMELSKLLAKMVTHFSENTRMVQEKATEHTLGLTERLIQGSGKIK